MVIFPVIAALVSGIFAVMLLRRFALRHGLPQLAWGIALSMYALASLIVAAGVAGGWDVTLFRMYWLLGALLNVPYLALGSVALLKNKVFTTLMVLGVAAGTLLALGAVVSTPAHLAGSPVDIPRGSAVWGTDPLAYRLSRFMSYSAYFLVVLIAVVSNARKSKSPHARNRVRGNWLIAGGATITAMGGMFARYGRGAVFSIALALGVVVMFVGFIWSSREPIPETKLAQEAK